MPPLFPHLADSPQSPWSGTWSVAAVGHVGDYYIPSSQAHEAEPRDLLAVGLRGHRNLGRAGTRGVRSLHSRYWVIHLEAKKGEQSQGRRFGESLWSSSSSLFPHRAGLVMSKEGAGRCLRAPPTVSWLQCTRPSGSLVLWSPRSPAR